MRKRVPIIICISVLTVLLIVAWFWSRVFVIEYIQSLYSENPVSFSCAPMENVFSINKFTDFEGNIYQRSHSCIELVKRRKNEEVSTFVESVFPCDQGIGFIDDWMLYHWNNGNRNLIAEHVSDACWDGTGFVWYDRSKNTIMWKTSGEAKELFHMDPSQLGVPITMLASDRWVIISPAYTSSTGYHGTFVFDRKNGILSSSFMRFDGYDTAFMCNDKLVKIGGNQDTFCVLDLETMNLTEFKTDIVASQGTVTASAAYDKEKQILYVSVYSKPELPEFYSVNTGTFAIDLEKSTIQKLNGRYYYMLCFNEQNQHLYGARDILGFRIICCLKT